jgi:hypothetical protein
MLDARTRGAMVVLLAALTALGACGTRRAPAPAGGQIQAPVLKRRLDPVTFSGLDVTVMQVSGQIRLDDAKDAKLSVTGSNATGSEVALGFRGRGESTATVPAGTTTKLGLSPGVRVAERTGGVRVVRLDLASQVNGLTSPRPVGTVEIDFLLPPGVPALIASSRPLVRLDAPIDGRIAYRLKEQNVRLTWIELSYTVSGVTLEIRKSLDLDTIPGAVAVRVTLRVRNLGTEEARNVVLEDTFDRDRFSGTGPEFSIRGSGGPGVRLCWTRTLDRIPAGQLKRVTYDVHARRALSRATFEPTIAKIGDRLVGVSNEVRLE